MVLLQHKLSVKLSQRQILTPGLVQMVSVLALNKLELKDMINAEMVENPVLEELEDAVPLIDEVGRQEEERDRLAALASGTEENPIAAVEKKEIEKPSFENFLSKPGNLTEHLLWQLGAISVTPPVHQAAEMIIGNLNEEGYLIASDQELLGVTPAAAPEGDAEAQAKIVGEAQALGLDAIAEDQPVDHIEAGAEAAYDSPVEITGDLVPPASEANPAQSTTISAAHGAAARTAPEAQTEIPAATTPNTVPVPAVAFTLADLHEALEVVRQFDPPGVACRDLRECLLYQLRHHMTQVHQHRNGNGATEEVLKDAIAVVDQHLKAVTLKQFKEIARAIGRPLEAVQAALECVRTLDPRPGLRYNKVPPRLIEPDVAFVKHGDEWLVVMNDEDLPQLRLNPAYKRLLTRDGNDRDTRNYVKERYKSAIQLIKNIEQRKQTIMKVCYSIVARQQDFLELGIDQLKPMMIKEVAEEIGVHPSTVSRAVANKYAHTPQGVFELRYFFSESVQ